MNEISVCIWRHLKIALESYLILLVWKITPWLNADLDAYLPKTVSLMPTVLRICILLKNGNNYWHYYFMSAWGQCHWYIWKSKENELFIENVQRNSSSVFSKMPTQLINETFQQKFKWNKHKEKLKRVILKTAVLWNIYLLWMPGTFVIKQVPIY